MTISNEDELTRLKDVGGIVAACSRPWGARSGRA